MPEPHDLTGAIWESAVRLGSRNAPRIADDLLARNFPESMAATERDGLSAILRRGLVEHVTRILKAANDDAAQIDLSEVDPSFRSLVRALKSKSYYVEALAEQVSVARLIAEPALLDDARRFMRRKGLECIEEARRLDALYEAVAGVAA